MNTGFYIRLAVSNIRKNSRTYVPYILTCIMTVMMYYMVKSLSLNPGIQKMRGADIIAYTMELGTWVIGLFALIFLFYTNSFLMKRRKKEFGLFNILGMGKSHLLKVVLVETLFVTFISLAAGLIFGIALDKAMFLMISKALGQEVTLGFFLSGKAVSTTMRFFGGVFLLIYLKSFYTVKISKPIELLSGSSVGEREPRAKWLLALGGMILLGTGYYLALTIDNPIISIPIFFWAVILVILATYLLFTAGSITVLKLMRKNSGFYYQTRHFITVSGMLYRMKRNAVGLANICILSTMVLVMVSSTSSMMIGMTDILRTRYPNDFGVYSRERDQERNHDLFADMDALCGEMGVVVEDRTKYSFVAIVMCEQGDTFLEEGAFSVNDLSLLNAIRDLYFIPLSDYNASSGEEHVLGQHEILFFSNRDKYEEPTVNLFGFTYRIAERLEHFFGNGVSAASITSSYYFVMNDKDFEELIETARAALGEYCNLYTYYGFDTPEKSEIQRELAGRMQELLWSKGINGYMESRKEGETGLRGMYSGLFFLGIFLGTLFIMATVLIIYYKQISEGYEDRERFEIMCKVGMTQKEVKSAIRSQVLTVFFLPLAAAGIHVAAAFPLITLILALLNMVNVRLYLLCTGACFLVFTVMYILIYSLTARVYYRIVNQ